MAYNQLLQSFLVRRGTEVHVRCLAWLHLTAASEADGPRGESVLHGEAEVIQQLKPECWMPCAVELHVQGLAAVDEGFQKRRGASHVEDGIAATVMELPHDEGQI